MRNYFMFLLLIVCKLSYSQSPPELLEIKEIKFKSEEFENSIEKFIQYRTIQDAPFRSGRGFIVINSQHVHSIAPPNAIAAFYINLDYYDLDNSESDELYPSYYSMSSSGRLIMIYEKDISKIAKVKFTSESKARLRALLEPFLPKSIIVPAINDSTKLMKRRESYGMQLHGGKYLFLLNDGSVVTKDVNQR